MNKRQAIIKLSERLASLSQAELAIVKSTLDALQFPEKDDDKTATEVVDKSARSVEPVSSDSSLFDILEKDDKHRLKKLEEVPDKDRPSTELTARGTPRVRRRYRTREEVGGDPHKEEHKLDVKMGGRVPRELRDSFVELANKKFPTQSAALTEAIREFLQKYQHDID
ncbi:MULTISPECIES: hypothetical protein [Alphaproteobacteria]|uniref:hypothetical protein n=1 Tax=Alphaproteobacteria TaxID=28211 RepID=UPI0032998A66